jgi:hypothetical protein
VPRRAYRHPPLRSAVLKEIRFFEDVATSCPIKRIVCSRQLDQQQHDAEMWRRASSLRPPKPIVRVEGRDACNLWMK